MSATTAAAASPDARRAPVAARRTRYLRAAGVAVGYTVAFVVLASGWVPCSFATLTHHPCPGCGTTRAALALFHGDFATAFRFNPLGPFVVAALAVIAGDAFRLVVRDGDLRAFADSKAASWALRVVLAASVLQLVVWIVRFFGYLGGPVPVG